MRNYDAVSARISSNGYSLSFITKHNLRQRTRKTSRPIAAVDFQTDGADAPEAPRSPLRALGGKASGAMQSTMRGELWRWQESGWSSPGRFSGLGGGVCVFVLALLSPRVREFVPCFVLTTGAVGCGTGKRKELLRGFCCDDRLRV